MQQLNILSMKVSQNVDNKDDSGALFSARSKDNFSQHIDLQLSKSRQTNNTVPNDKVVYNDRASLKTEKPTIEQQTLRTDDKILDKSEYHQAVADNADLAVDVQEVAASDKQDEPDIIIVDADDKKIIDESELLMTFLTKVDKTLLTEAPSDKAAPLAVNVNETSDEQVIKLEAKSVQKPNGLVTDLSSVAKAVSSTTEMETDTIQGQNKLINSFISENNNKGIVQGESTNDNGIVNSVSNKLLIDGGSSTVDELATEKLISSVPDKVNMNGANNPEVNVSTLAEKNILANNTIVEPEGVSSMGENISQQKLVETGIESQSTTQADIEIKTAPLQQNMTTANKEASLNDASISVKDVLGTAKKTDDSASELQTNSNEELIKAENSVSVVKNDLSTVDVESGRPQNAPVKNNDNLTSQVINKNAVPNNLEQSSVAPSTEEASTHETEEMLSEQSIDKLIEQNKTLDADGNKSVGNKASVVADIEEPNNRSNFIGEASKTSQDAYDRVVQQSSDAMALTANSDVAQSQKTNTQLHQETISIFRRDFADAVKDKVMLVISQKLQQFDITLDPPELGNVQVRVNLQGEQATVNFVVQNQQAKEAFEQNMHKLREQLAEQGVDVGDANVEQQSQQSDAEASSGGSQSQFSQGSADTSDVVEHSLSVRRSDSSTKVIDYYA